MTIVEISEALPNGFHDACLRNISIDLINCKANLDLDVWIGSMKAPDEERREASRQGRLTIINLLAVIIDPPAAFMNSRDRWWINEAGTVEPLEFPAKIETPWPNGTFVNAIYTNYSSIYIAATDAEFFWK